MIPRCDCRSSDSGTESAENTYINGLSIKIFCIEDKGVPSMFSRTFLADLREQKMGPSVVILAPTGQAEFRQECSGSLRLIITDAMSSSASSWVELDLSVPRRLALEKIAHESV